MARAQVVKLMMALIAAALLLAPEVARGDNIQVGYCAGTGCSVTSFVTVTGATPIAPLSSGTDAFAWSGAGFSLSGTVTSGAGGPLGGGLVGDSVSVAVSAIDGSGTAGNVELIVQQNLSVFPIDTSLPGLAGYPLPNLPNDEFTVGPPGSSLLSGTCNAAAMADGSSVSGLFQVLGGGTPPTGLGWSNLRALALRGHSTEREVVAWCSLFQEQAVMSLPVPHPRR